MLFVILMSILTLTLSLSACSDEHEHVFSKEWTVTVEATTETEGEESNVCDECNETVTRKTEKHTHTYSDSGTVTTPATKDKDGIITKVCDGCGESTEEAVKYCENHTYSTEWTILSKPTMSSIGRERNVCTACGATVIRPIPKLEVTELVLTEPPTTTTYFIGERFNSYGMKISGILSDGSSVEIKDYEVVTTLPLTNDVTNAEIKYGELTLLVPITVSNATYTLIGSASGYEDGTLLYVDGYCIGSLTGKDGAKETILRDYSADKFMILRGASYNYKVGDRIGLLVTLESDENGKYLKYSTENKSPEALVSSSNNFIDFRIVANGNANSTEKAESAFGAEGIKTCDVIEFYGLFYLMADEDRYVIHFSEDATNENGAMLSSGKALKLSAENIDGSIISDRLPFDTAAYPGVLVNGTIKAMYTYSDTDSIYLEILDKDWVSIDLYVEGQEYLTEVAYSFYYQLPYVDYEQYNSRRNINPAPEDATEQQRIYLDCSSYVNAVYYNAFGVNILPYAISEKSASTANFMAYARENQNAIDVLGYWESRDYDTEEEQDALLKSIYDQLQIGDVIVYRKGNIETLEESAGHALIYVGGGKILHCMNTGSYEHASTAKNSSKADPLSSYDQIDKNSVGFESCHNLFESRGATRYLFKYVNFTVLRPLNRGLTPTEQAKARMTIPSLSIEKLVDVNMFSAVFTNDLITYTITLKNNGETKLNNVTLSEAVPMGTEFVSATDGILHTDGEISWTGEVDAASTVTLSFTVKVTASEPGTLIESNEGTVNGLKLNKITNTVSGINRETLEGIGEIGKGFAESENEYTDPILMINAVYNELIGKNILDYATVSDALLDIINLENKRYNTECAVNDAVIENFVGGYLIRGANPLMNDRIRAIRIEYLTAGDVILAEHTSKKDVKIYTAYIYLGGDEFLCVTSVDGICTVEKNNEPDIKKIQNLLTSLYSYEKYAIIRPSMAYTAESN